MSYLSKRKEVSKGVGQLGIHPHAQVNFEFAGVNMAIGFQDAILTEDNNKITTVEKLLRDTLWRNKKQMASGLEGENNEMNENIMGIILCTLKRNIDYYRTKANYSNLDVNEGIHYCDRDEVQLAMHLG